jgi:O-antigen/teichoic acid export membrane protein
LTPHSAVSSRLLITNAIWNIVGRIAPVFVAILTTPKLIHLLGLSRWGVFTLALSLIGTFGIFDLGLGRALSRAVASRPPSTDNKEIADLILTGVAVLACIGVIAGLVLSACVDVWVYHGLKIPDELRREVLFSLFVFCATAPLVMINAALWGVLTGFHAFKATNLINIPISLMYYIGPMLMLYLWDSLIAVMIVLAGCRLWMAIAYIRLTRRLVPELKQARLQPDILAPLFRYGSWLTVSNVLYPILTYLDRFVVSSVIPVAATSFYTTPFDAVNRFSMLTASITASAFPAISSSYHSDPPKTVKLYKTSSLAISSILLPICLSCALLSYDILELWIDQDFAENGSQIMKILCLGIYISGVDSTTGTFLEAIGRPDIASKITILQFFIYFPLLYFLLIKFGLIGASIAWTTRIVIDFSIRSVASMRIYPSLRRTFFRGLPAVVTGGGALVIAQWPLSALAAVTAEIPLLLLFYAVIWLAVLTESERGAVIAILNNLLSRVSRRGIS